jgi:hypothetical protein
MNPHNESALKNSPVKIARLPPDTNCGDRRSFIAAWYVSIDMGYVAWQDFTAYYHVRAVRHNESALKNSPVKIARLPPVAQLWRKIERPRINYIIF